MTKSKGFAIKHIYAREIFDSRGNPTIETHVTLESGISAKAAVPSGASTGIYEAVELRDGDNKRFNGKGVQKAIKNVNTKIFPLLLGEDVRKQKRLDTLMIELDETDNKAYLGANAILSVSLACARAGALYKNMPLYRYIADLMGIKNKNLKMPIPGFNVINGGRHADNNVDFQEFMLFPMGVKTFKKRMQAGVEIFHILKEVLKKKKLSTGVGDEGGFAPELQSNKQALDLIVEAIKKSNWKLGKEIFIAMDPATSEFYDKKHYVLKGEGSGVKRLASQEMIAYWGDLITKYPIYSIEDPLDQNDWDGWSCMTKELGKKLQIVGDDFLVTNPQRIEEAIQKRAANAVLIKVNQIGTLTETLEAIKLAKAHKWHVMVSHRSGETTDTFIADLVVGTQAEQIKSGSLSRGERLCKYNRLMEIEEEIKAK